MEAAQTAPLALGDDKTTHITVVQETETLNDIREAAQLTTKTGKKIDAFYGVPTIIFLSATDLSPDHIEYSNVACVIENMILQATALNIGSTYIWGCLRKLRNRPDVLEKLNLPENYEILSAMAVGYPVSPLTERGNSEKISLNRI